MSEKIKEWISDDGSRIAVAVSESDVEVRVEASEVATTYLTHADALALAAFLSPPTPLTNERIAEAAAAAWKETQGGGGSQLSQFALETINGRPDQSPFDRFVRAFHRQVGALQPPPDPLLDHAGEMLELLKMHKRIEDCHSDPDILGIGIMDMQIDFIGMRNDLLARIAQGGKG